MLYQVLLQMHDKKDLPPDSIAMKWGVYILYIYLQ